MRAALKRPYITMRHRDGTTLETPEQRAAEFERTLASVFSRKPRTHAASSPSDTPNPRQLPNRVREELLRQGLTNPARLIDALYSVGLEPGTAITVPGVVSALSAFTTSNGKPAFSCDTVYSTLNATARRVDVATGELLTPFIFVGNCHPIHSICMGGGSSDKKPHNSVSPPPPDAVTNERTADPRANARENATVTPAQPDCTERAGTDAASVGVERKRGRKAVQYKLPTPDELAALLFESDGETSALIQPGVKLPPAELCDVLPTLAFSSPTAYRSAVNTALIQRREGNYTRKFLSERVGVSARTLYRYTGKAEIVVTPAFKELAAITWANADQKLTDDPDAIAGLRGVWLEDEHGRRYAPRLSRARSLLNAGRRLTLMRQIASHYRAPDAANGENEGDEHTPALNRSPPA